MAAAGMQGGGGTSYVRQMQARTAAAAYMPHAPSASASWFSFPWVLILAGIAFVALSVVLTGIFAIVWWLLLKGRGCGRRVNHNGQCVDCTSTSNSCGEGVCVDNQCGQCATDEQCVNIAKEMGWTAPSATVVYKCELNRCTRTCTGNGDCSQLGALGVCTGGTCKECAANTDCATGQTCSQNRCTECDASDPDSCSDSKKKCILDGGVGKCATRCSVWAVDCDTSTTGACVDGACVVCDPRSAGNDATEPDPGCTTPGKGVCRDFINFPKACAACASTSDCNRGGKTGLQCVNGQCVKAAAASGIQLQLHPGTDTAPFYGDAPLIAYVQPETGRAVATVYKANVTPDMVSSTTWTLIPKPVTESETIGAGTHSINKYALATQLGGHWYVVGACCGSTIQNITARSSPASDTCGNCVFGGVSGPGADPRVNPHEITQLVPIQSLGDLQHPWIVRTTVQDPFAFESTQLREPTDVNAATLYAFTQQWSTDSGEETLDLSIGGDATLAFVPLDSADFTAHQKWWHFKVL